MEYLGGVLGSLLTSLLIICVVLAFGYLLGAITIKGVSLGSAGVLLVAIIVGVIFSFVDTIEIGGKTIYLWTTAKDIDKLTEIKNGVTQIKPSTESIFKTIQDLGTLLFVTSVGLIAGPKFFRSFNKNMIAYVVMGAAIVLCGVGITILLAAIDPNMKMPIATGLLAGSLTSTPAFGAAQEAAGDYAGDVTTGYGLGYIYGVLGVVLFVQLLPKILKVDIAKERETFVAANTIQIKDDGKKRFQIEEFGFFPFFLTVIFGLLIGGLDSDIKGFLYVKLCVASLLTFAICTVGINTTAFWLLYSKVGYGTYLVSRLFVQGQIWNSLVNYALLFGLIPLLNRIKPLKIYLK